MKKKIAVVLILMLQVTGPVSSAANSEGQRLAYMLGCINCHHQTPKAIINAPPLFIVKTYSLEQFRSLLKTGITSTGRDLLDIGSLMGVVAVEQFSYLEDDEILMLFNYLKDEWNHEQALIEEKKIPLLHKHPPEQAGLD